MGHYELRWPLLTRPWRWAREVWWEIPRLQGKTAPTSLPWLNLILTAAKKEFSLCSQGNGLRRFNLGSDSHPSPAERSTETINSQSTKPLLISKRNSAPCRGLAEAGAMCPSNCLLSCPLVVSWLVMRWGRFFHDPHFTDEEIET